MSRFSNFGGAKKKNPKDENLKIPSGAGVGDKDVWGLLRKLFNLTEDDDISEEFKFVTDLQTIEEHLFGKTIQMGQDFFVLRLYVRHNVLSSFGDKMLGR